LKIEVLEEGFDQEELREKDLGVIEHCFNGSRWGLGFILKPNQFIPIARLEE